MCPHHGADRSGYIHLTCTHCSALYHVELRTELFNTRTGHTIHWCETSGTENPSQSIADIIMLDIQIQPGRYVRDQLLLRILGLKMAATAVIPLGMLELWAFIILWLEPKHHKQRHALVLVRGELVLVVDAEWVCLGMVPQQRKIITAIQSEEHCGATVHRVAPEVKLEHINHLDLSAVQLSP